MPSPTEPRDVAIVRRVCALLLRAAGVDGLAEKLDAADPEAVANLRPHIVEANRAWEQDAKAIAIRDEGFFPEIRPAREDDDIEGPIVHFYWGWESHTEGAPARLRTTGEFAVDLAFKILDLFRDENGEFVRPERPELPENEGLSRIFESWAPITREYMAATEGGSCSFLELSIWNRIGRPVPVPEHQWTEYEQDHVRVCSACRHWCSTDRDDFPVRVCPGSPIDDDDFASVDRYDPRRSSELREAQRLDVLVHLMRKYGATLAELRPFEDALAVSQLRLSEEEVARFNRERAA